MNRFIASYYFKKLMQIYVKESVFANIIYNFART